MMALIESQQLEHNDKQTIKYNTGEGISLVYL